jgi:hypothetical protein
MAARCEVFLQLPTLAECAFLPVSCADTVGSLVARALSGVGLPDASGTFHLYGLAGDFTAIPDSAPCSALFLARYRALTLLPYRGERVTVLYEGRRAAVDLPAKSLAEDLIAAAVQCLGLSLANGDNLILLDSKRLTVALVDDAVPCPLLVLKRVNLYGSDAVFTGKTPFVQFVMPLFVMAKLVLSAPITNLLSSLRSFKPRTFKLAAFSEERLGEVMSIYRGDGGHLADALTVPEMNSLLFLLLGVNAAPLLPPDLARLALATMATRDDPTRYEQVAALVLLLPLGTHAVVSEVALTYAAVMGEDRHALAGLLRDLLFGEAGDARTQQQGLAFVSFLLLCSQKLFAFPPKPGRELKVHGDRIVLFDFGMAITWEGPVSVAVADTKPLETGDSETILRKWWAVVPPEEPWSGAELLAVVGKTNAAYRELEAKTAVKRSLGDFEFEGLFPLN